MKILHVVPSFAPCFSHGGVVNASYQIAKSQVENGHEVSVFTTDSCDKRLRFEKNYNVNVDGIKVYYFKNLSNNIKNKLTIDTPIKLPNYLRKNIKNYDIIHLHEHRHSLAVAAHKYAKKNNIPYVLQAHGSVLPFFQKEQLKNIFDRLWGFKILNNASRVFALTDVEKQQYLKMGIDENRIEIVPLGINLDEYSKLPEKGLFKSKYDISYDEKLILFLGRIHEIKGLDLLIKSLNQLKYDNVKLAIVGGDYGYLDTVKKLINKFKLDKKIIFTGVLTGNDKYSALTDCDIFVMPSRYESFTTSGLEAMACGKPLVLTKNNHIYDWVDNNVGLCCEFDENELSDCFNKLLNDEQICEEFGRNGKKLVYEKYNWNTIEKQIENIYKTCLNEYI